MKLLSGFPSKRQRRQKMKKIPHLLQGPVMACLLLLLVSSISIWMIPSSSSSSLLAVVEGVAVASIVLPRAKIRPRPSGGGGGGGYSWEASVDPNTGTASSREVTQAPPHSRVCQQLLRDTKEIQQQQQQQPGDTGWSEIRYKLEHYPQWLARGAVTLGLFRTVPIAGQKGSGSSCSLQDRFFGIDLLIFGSVTSRIVQTKQRLPRFLQVLKRNQPPEGACIGSHSMTVTVPIVGGLLAVQKEKRQKSEDLGYLEFTLQQNKNQRNSATDDATQIEEEEVLIITKIKNYSPMLVGTREPPRLLRKATYLSTQSIFHAYVMWRFHKYCIHSERSFPPPSR